jgi:hypothetical protein
VLSCSPPQQFAFEDGSLYHLVGLAFQMVKQRLKLTNIGPIAEADVHFGDLTVLVGPQATGKSIFLQFLKLLLDANPILGYLNEHGLNWHKSTRDFLELYLGEGTGGIWVPRQAIYCGKEFG